MSNAEKNADEKRFALQGKKTLHQGHIITLVENTYKVENKLTRHDVIKHPGAVVILPLTENQEVIFIRQYRIPIDEILLELPAGVIEKGEDHLYSADRELREETGYKAERLTFLTELIVAPGYSDERLFVFVGKNLVESPLVGEDSHIIDIVKLPLDEAIDRVFKNEIKDAKTIAALLMYKGLS